MAFACNLHVAAGGNRFMVDLARLYAAALIDLKVDADVRIGEVPQGGKGVVDVIVAPHEYFVVGPALTEREKRLIVERCVLLTTEQPSSPWWGVQEPWVQAAPVVLDLSPLGVEELRRSGVGALRAPVGYHPSIDAWGGDGDTERDIDVCFLGGSTARRRSVLGRVAPVLSHRSSRLLFHDPLTPVTDASRTFVSGREKAELLARSRLLVNVHRDDIPYFEWVRAIEAISNGALLLTEPSSGIEPLEPMVHMMVADSHLFAAHVTALLADEPLRAKIARAAYDFVRSEMRMTDLLAGEVLVALREAPANTKPFTPAAALLPSTVATLPSGFDLEAASSRPKPPPAIEVPETAEYRTMAGLKRALLGQIRLGRRLDRIELERSGVDPHGFERRATPCWESASPDLSVIVPLFNYEATITDALESVLASRHVSVEVLVVEDCSTDDSRAVVERFMDEHPDAPVAGLFRSANRGLSEARNLGITEARTDRFFLLDADNAVYPDALWKLNDELDATGAAFAYCILEVFEGPPDLVSALPWSPRSLALRPYIDAMSLLRREAWEAVGGFSEGDDAIYGLEDYAFWLALADQGFEGAWVPEPLVRYRRHPGSMTGVTALDLVTPFNSLRHRFPDLPW